MKLKFTLITTFLGACALAAFLFWKSRQSDDAVKYETYQVKPITASRSILARGILQCSETTPAIVKTRGRITELLPQGTPVKKGDILFQIDDSSAREEIENQESSLHTTELSLVRLNTQRDLVEFQETQTINLRKAQLDHAILEEKMELAEPLPRDRRIMEIEEELAQLNLEEAQDNYDREHRLFTKQYISASALEPFEQKLENAKATLDELLLQNKLKKKGPTDERKVELNMAVRRARANMERMEKRKERRVNDIMAQIEAEERELKVIKHRIAYSENEIAQAAVKANSDGLFKVRTYRDWTSGGLIKEISVGEEKRQQDVVGDVIDPTRMEVKLVVNEADYHYLKEGMKVKLSMPAIAEKTFEGTLKQLGAIGRDRNRVDPTALDSGDSEISMFNANIAFDGQGVIFHPGMSALIEIIIEQSQDHILIPRSAVKQDDNGQFQVILTDHSTKTVEGTYFNDMYFAIREGLAQGDYILVPTTNGLL